MGDQDDGAAAHQPLDRVDDRRLRFLIDGAGRLVQDQHRAVFQERPGDGDALALAAGELDPALAHLGLIAVGEPHDEFVRVGRLGGGDHLALARTWPGIRDVLGDAGREEHRILRHHGELQAQIVQPVIADVDAVQPDLSLRRVVESRGEQDVLQHAAIGAVREGHVAKGDGPGGPGEGPGAGPLDDIRRLVEHRERPLGGDQVGLQAGGFPADGLQRGVQLVEITHDHEKLAQGEGVGAHVAETNKQDGGRPRGGGQTDEDVELSFHECLAHPCPHHVAAAPEVPLFLPCLLAEGLHDAQGAQHFLDDPKRGAVELFRLPRLAAQAPAEEPGGHDQRRRNRDGDQRQLPVDAAHDVDHPDQRDAGADKGDGAFCHDLLNVGDVVLDPVHGIRGAFAVVVGE